MSGTSGTYVFNPSLAELTLDAYERCGKLGVDLTVQGQEISSARRSANLVLAGFANRGINLWTVDLVAQFMPQGVVQYFDDASCIDILPDSVTLRQYLMAAPSSVTPSFTTTINTPTVTISGFNGTPIAGGYINVGVQVSVGGIVLYGFYQVQSVPGSGQATITAASNATSSVTNGGAVPVFTTTTSSTTVSVALNNHGLLADQAFQVPVSTSVGGLQLLGPYTVGPSPTTNAFTITSSYPAGSSATASENNGQTQLATQASIGGNQFTDNPTDLLLYPLSRGEYQAIPDKSQAGRPTSFWVNRQVVPVINVWLVPDQNGPYELRYYRSRQIQDADLISGQQLQLPYRMLEAFTSAYAAHLAMKWAPDRAQGLAAYAAQQWDLASAEDSEHVEFFIAPDMSGYYDV